MCLVDIYVKLNEFGCFILFVSVFCNCEMLLMCVGVSDSEVVMFDNYI